MKTVLDKEDEFVADGSAAFWEGASIEDGPDPATDAGWGWRSGFLAAQKSFELQQSDGVPV